VTRFPKDVLPRFYYGVVKTLRGYDGLDEAIEQFNFVLRSQADDLVADAKYNLAVAHIERYSAHDAEVAMDLLRETRDEVAKREKSSRAKDPKLETLRLQALILEAYLYVQENVWYPSSEEVFQVAEQLLTSFWADYNRSVVVDNARRDLLADYYNTWGYYWNGRAKGSEGSGRTLFAEKAKADYERALGYKQEWIPAKSNLARLYQDFLHDQNTAKRLWQEILQVRPNDHFTLYLLGQIHEAEGAYAPAIGSYKRAGTRIPEANLKLGLLYEKLGAHANAALYLERVLAATDVREKTRLSADLALRRIRNTQSIEGHEPTTPS